MSRNRGLGTNRHSHKGISDLFPFWNFPVGISLDKQMMELVRNDKENFRSNCQPRKLKVDPYVRVAEKEHKGHPLMYLCIPWMGKLLISKYLLGNCPQESRHIYYLTYVQSYVFSSRDMCFMLFWKGQGRGQVPYIYKRNKIILTLRNSDYMNPS